MSEISQRLQHISETRIVMLFRAALVALYPTLVELDCVENDTSLYDPFDRVAETLWAELVLGSLQWKYGLHEQPKLPLYGFSGIGPTADGYIRVADHTGAGQFISFHGDREFGTELFNAVTYATPTGGNAVLPLGASTQFEWVRGTVA